MKRDIAAVARLKENLAVARNRIEPPRGQPKKLLEQEEQAASRKFGKLYDRLVNDAFRLPRRRKQFVNAAMKMLRNTICEHVFLDLLNKVTAKRQWVSYNSHAENYAPKIFSMRPDRERFTEKDFERAMKVLLDGKGITIDQNSERITH